MNEMSEIVEPGRQRIAIVGGGFSGTMTLVQLLKQAALPLHIILFERSTRQLARGMAYSTPFACHLLNVPAGAISALPDDPGHFLDWARRNLDQKALDGEQVQPGSFLPRHAYGEYLTDLLHQTIAAYRDKHIVEIREEEVIDIDVGREHAVLVSRSGVRTKADQVVLTIGNFPPADPPTALGHGGYFPNPWGQDVLPSLVKGDSCLIIGSGLTMLDLVLSLQELDYRGVVHVVSRRGLMPRAHSLENNVLKGFAPMPGSSLRQLTRTIREQVAQSNGDWRAVVDAMRPHNATLWQRLSHMDQMRFIRHVRPFWENHRHRSAPALYQKFQSLISRGVVHMHRGRVIDITDVPDGLAITLRYRGNIDLINVEQAVNCTGAECNFRKLSSDLIQNMLARGLIACNRLGFGVQAAPDGSLLDSSGAASPLLFTMGPPIKGGLWETTAVPELRKQAVAIAARLLSVPELNSLP